MFRKKLTGWNLKKLNGYQFLHCWYKGSLVIYTDKNDLCISGGRRQKTEGQEVPQMNQWTSSGSCCWERIFHQLMFKYDHIVKHSSQMHLFPWALTVISKNSWQFINYVPTSTSHWLDPSYTFHELILTATFWNRYHSFLFMDEVQQKKDQSVRKW